MKNTINKQAEALKKNIDSASQKSKETIKTLVDTNSKQFDSAITLTQRLSILSARCCMKRTWTFLS